MPKITLLVLLLCGTAFAQHSVTLVLVDDVNPVGTVYSYYRADGPCQSGQTFSVIAAKIGKSYVDTAVTSGAVYCYQATSDSSDGLYESAPSTQAQAVIPTDTVTITGRVLQP